MKELRGLVLGWAALGILAGALGGCDGEVTGTGGGGSGGGGGQSTTTGDTTSTTACTNTVDLADGECRQNEDCTDSIASCAPPGSPSCGGAGCGLEPCGIDSDCPADGTPMVCEIEACCGDKRCVPGCLTDTDCPEGSACADNQHCVPQPCDTQACPDNFDCGDGAAPSCRRRPCSCDSECEGTCVEGACHEGPGTCELPKP